MEFANCKQFLKDDNYVHCSICGNYRNYNSFAHRKSKDHQKKMSLKLRKIAFHLSQKKKKQVVIHDEQWQEKDSKRFCHFCSNNYIEHYQDGEFIVEHLGSLYHHANSCHAESVKAFLKRNFSEEKIEKYCIQKKHLDSFLGKLPEAKEKYLKKMDVLNKMILKQIKDSEEERKRLGEEFQAQSLLNSYQVQNSTLSKNNKHDAVKFQYMSNKMNKSDVKLPPWLEDVSDNSTTLASSSSAPVIGPTIDTLIKHVTNQKKKGLSKNRIGANFKHTIQGSTKWLPSFQGVWNQGRRKQLQIQFKHKNPKFCF